MEHKTRIVHDTMGELEVPFDALWGAQTQRSLQNFPIGNEKMPPEQIKALLEIKWAAALSHAEMGRMSAAKADVIAAVCETLVSGVEVGDLTPFPLAVWQTGSGTQTNMNVNEVVAEMCRKRRPDLTFHPNDDINMGQSSNDVFPAAMHIAAKRVLEKRVIPEVQALIASFDALEQRCQGIVKVGRTHLQDAVPIGLDQEISGWSGLLRQSLALLKQVSAGLTPLALGGTAVGTGLNAWLGFDQLVAQKLCEITELEFTEAPNKFTELSGKQQVAAAHSGLKMLANGLFKVVNDIRLLGSGPRCGLGELLLPANEPGSSIMPGKVNPTQCEAVSMLCVQVMGNDVAVSFGAASGAFELNTYMPLIIYNFLQSANLLADGCACFRERCVDGIGVNEQQIKRNVDHALMLVTRLAPTIGYENCADIVKTADRDNISLKEAALASGLIDDAKYDELMQLHDMLYPQPPEL